jgi:hypothetical protein
MFWSKKTSTIKPSANRKNYNLRISSQFIHYLLGILAGAFCLYILTLTLNTINFSIPGDSLISTETINNFKLNDLKKIFETRTNIVQSLSEKQFINLF